MGALRDGWIRLSVALPEWKGQKFFVRMTEELDIVRNQGV